MAQDEPGLRCDSDVVLVRRDGAQPRGTRRFSGQVENDWLFRGGTPQPYACRHHP